MVRKKSIYIASGPRIARTEKHFFLACQLWSSPRARHLLSETVPRVHPVRSHSDVVDINRFSLCH